MARGSLTFRQADITRALKAVVAAGAEVVRVEVDKEGKIVIVVGKPGAATDKAEGEGEWDRL
jgi:hypothetical protein